MSQPPLVLTEHAGRVAIIRLNRPPVNALNAALLDELDAAIGSFHADPAVGVAVLVGSERAFAAGADMREMGSFPDAASARPWLRRGHDVLRRLERGPKPVIAAITGFCLGGGCEMVLACHLRIAGESARIGQPEIKIGVVPGWGGSQRLPRLVGLGRALEMLLTGEPVDAPAALAMGLVNAVVPDAAVLPRATRLAETIASFPEYTVREMLATTLGGLEQSLAAGLATEIEHFAALIGTDGMREGIAAFLEKRPPRFHG